MNITRALLVFAALGAAVLPARVLAWSQAEAEAGRALSARYGKAIVGVEVVATIKMNVAGRAQPVHVIRLETNGTMVSAAGLTAASLTQIDPRRTAEAVTRNVSMSSGQRIQVGDTEYNEINLRLSDGTVLPAKIVMRDADLDLALLAPVDPLPANAEISWVRLDAAAAPALLGNYFVVSRAPATLQRVPEIHQSTIEGIVEKPIQVFIPNGFVTGCPMLDADGKLLGLCLSQIVDGHALMVGGHPSGIVLATAEIAHLATPFLSVHASVDQKALPGDHLAVVGSKK